MTEEPLGWIGTGRMGYAMAERLAKAGCDLTVWNRTREKAEPLAKYGAKIVGRPADLAGCDIVFCMVSTWDDVKEVMEGRRLFAGTASRRWWWSARRSRSRPPPSCARSSPRAA